MTLALDALPYLFLVLAVGLLAGCDEGAIFECRTPIDGQNDLKITGRASAIPLDQLRRAFPEARKWKCEVWMGGTK